MGLSNFDGLVWLLVMEVGGLCSFRETISNISQVLNQRSALLSNFEVLTLLRELESDHLAKTRTAIRVKKEEEAAGTSASRVHVPQEQVLENLRTIEVEVRNHIRPYLVYTNSPPR